MNNINKPCNKCGDNKKFVIIGNMHKGLYCLNCGSFIKWMNKDDHNFAKLYDIPIRKDGETK